MPRKLSPYEKTHLLRFGKSDVDITEYGEMPVEYMTGKVEFGEQIFAINPTVLIPRIETEELLTLALEKVIKSKKEAVTIADVGCGSGAIGISLWLKLQQKNINVTLYLSDISDQAVAVAKENVRQLIKKNGAVRVLKSDLFLNYPDQVKFDLIVANLPYIPTKQIASLDESVRDYEPHLALDGGDDGLKYIKKIVAQAQNKLKPRGAILLEVDQTHNTQFLQKKINLESWVLKTHLDQFQRLRFVTLTQKNHLN